MKVNFFVIAPPAVLEGFPASFISAFRLEPGSEPLINELATRFPNLTVVDVAAAVRQAQDVIDQLINAVQFVFLFALGAGPAGAVLGAGRHRGRAPPRSRGDARLRRLARPGHRHPARRVPRHGRCSPACSPPSAPPPSASVLARRVFELDLPPSLALWIAGPLAGLALLSLNAWLSSRKVLRASPALTLRDSV